MKKSIGLDIGKKEIEASVFDGEAYRNKTYKNTKDGLNRMVRDFRKEGESVIIIEATGTYYLRCTYKLNKEGFDVRVVNPLIIKRYSELKLRRVKTDKADARIIASFGYREETRRFKPDSTDKMRLKVLSSEIKQINSDISRNKSRIEALEQYPEEMTESIERLRERNKMLKKDLKKVQKEIDKIIKDNKKYKEVRKRLKTIKGVGPRLSSAIIAYMGAYESFDSAKQVASYIGVTPTLKQSGDSVYKKGGISKMGNKYIRSLLIMCAKSAILYNPQCKALDERLRLKGKIYTERLAAVGHKLLRQTYGVIKSGENYKKDYLNEEVLLHT